jgi:hypothetical protein
MAMAKLPQGCCRFVVTMVTMFPTPRGKTKIITRTIYLPFGIKGENTVTTVTSVTSIAVDEASKLY